MLVILLNSPDVNTALNTPVDPADTNTTFKRRAEQLVLTFITQQSNKAQKDLDIYTDFLKTAYLKNENRNRDEKVYLFKNKLPGHAYIEYALNTYLFNLEQVRLFYGSIADYKTAVDLNKRGGQVLANGIPNTLRGFFNGATISDIKIKSKIYSHMINTMIKILGYENETISVRKLNKIYTEKELKSKKVLNDLEREIYNIVSPYLLNDSANAVSLITFDEFTKRIEGFGLGT